MLSFPGVHAQSPPRACLWHLLLLGVLPKGNLSYIHQSPLPPPWGRLSTFVSLALHVSWAPWAHLGNLRHLQDVPWAPLNPIDLSSFWNLFLSSFFSKSWRLKTIPTSWIPVCFLLSVVRFCTFLCIFIHTCPVLSISIDNTLVGVAISYPSNGICVLEVSFAFSSHPDQLPTPTELSFQSTALTVALCSHSQLPTALHCSFPSSLAWCPVWSTCLLLHIPKLPSHMPMLAIFPPCSQPHVPPASGQLLSTSVQPTGHSLLRDFGLCDSSSFFLPPSPWQPIPMATPWSLLHLNPPLKSSSLTTALSGCFSRCVTLSKSAANLPSFLFCPFVSLPWPSLSYSLWSLCSVFAAMFGSFSKPWL